MYRARFLVVLWVLVGCSPVDNSSVDVTAGPRASAAPQDISSSYVLANAKQLRSLQGSRSLKCTFPWVSSVLWDSDKPVVEKLT